MGWWVIVFDKNYISNLRDVYDLLSGGSGEGHCAFELHAVFGELPEHCDGRTVR